jgi:hypothetical protein
VWFCFINDLLSLQMMSRSVKEAAAVSSALFAYSPTLDLWCVNPLIMDAPNHRPAAAVVSPRADTVVFQMASATAIAENEGVI